MNLRAHFSNNQFYYILFLCCLISRIVTSVYYIEDIDSLRFAYSIVLDYDISKLQPHFPGYAVFCFLGNILYFFTGNLGLVFSFIGSLSTFFIIYFSIKILEYEIYSLESLFLTLLIMFNPLIWIMSNRYMPDLMGLALFGAIFYYLSENNKKSIIIGGFLTGLLLGVRLSYFPLILLFSFQFIYKNQNRLNFIYSIIFGVIIWLFPMIWVTGLEKLFSLGWKHTLGHFTEYGGTIITENSLGQRLSYLFQTIWADGLGGYWLDRSYFTLLLSILFIPLFYNLVLYIKELLINNEKIRNLLICGFIYLIWILLFQNIIYKSRHVLPLVLILLIIFSITQKNFINKKNSHYIYLFSLITLLGFISTNLNIHHKNKTAIAQLSEYLTNKNKESISIVSIPLINYYLKSQNLKANYHDINIQNKMIDLNNINRFTYIIGDFEQLVNNKYTISLDSSFYHNPYINRMWSSINIYSLTKNSNEYR